jgi:aspartyl-tRNA(Asn)/glutamyl-tRNA(Gln) amidotransferase subunit C
MITKKDVEYVASLARIHLKGTEVDHLTKDLEKILGYIHQLNTLDVSDIQPTSHVLPLKNVHREDKVRPSLNQKEVLKFAIQQHDGFFKVPKVID